MKNKKILIILIAVIFSSVIFFPDTEVMHLSGHTCVDSTHTFCDGGNVNGDFLCDCDGLGCNDALNK